MRHGRGGAHASCPWHPSPDELKNQSHVKDPMVTDLLVRQRRTVESAGRREILAELQRYLAHQQYYVQLSSAITIAVWDGALKNYGPNHGYDYGGRLMAAWLDRQDPKR
jgi:ABC-type transport system substrate-binding protein